jgi:acyl carrier protein
MTEKFQSKIAEIIADRAGVQVGDIHAEINVLSGLGIDSITLLDVTYDIDREFGITLPVERWMDQVNSGEASLGDFFVFKNLVGHVVALAK